MIGRRRDARNARGLAVGADRIEPPPEGGRALQRAGEENEDDDEDQNCRQAADRSFHEGKEGVRGRAARRPARVTQRSGSDDDAAGHRHDEGRNIQPDHPDRIERAYAGAEEENRGYQDPF